MRGLILGYLFVLGCCMGSFLNVLASRIPRGEHFLTGRSRCEGCGRTLAWYELVPVLSFAVLLGRCRTCKAKLSLRYPLTELGTGALLLLCFWRYGFSWGTPVAFYTLCVLAVISLIDWDTMTIPNGLILALIPGALAGIWAFPGVTVWSRLTGAFAVSLPMGLMTLVIPDCFGGGDVKLMAVCGFLLGLWGTLFAAFGGVLTGGIYAISILIRKGRQKGAHMPFGPFLSLGVGVALLWGQAIIAWYLGLFGL